MRAKTTVQVSNQMIVVTNRWDSGAMVVRQLEIRPGVEIPLEGLEEFLLESKYEAINVHHSIIPRNYDHNLSS